jgi:hypothetical protein
MNPRVWKPVSLLIAAALVPALLAVGAKGAEPRNHWPLNERSGRVATDVASGADGELLGFDNEGDEHWVEGKLRGGLSLATGSSRSNHLAAELPALDASLTGGFTIAMWVRVGSIVANRGEYQLFNSPGDAIGFTIFNDTFQGIVHGRVLLFWDGSLNHIVVGTTSLLPGRWYHVAVTSTGVGGQRELYINGDPEAKRFFVASGGVDAGHSNGWAAGTARIGAFNPVGGRWHDSIIDDVRVYDTALTPQEVEELFLTEPAEEVFVRGDSNSDGEVDITDGIQLLNFLFLGGVAPECLDAADVDDDGGASPTITDAIALFNWLFLGGSPPEDPVPLSAEYGPDSCGPDPTPDAMGCLAPSMTCQ